MMTLGGDAYVQRSREREYEADDNRTETSEVKSEDGDDDELAKSMESVDIGKGGISGYESPNAEGNW
eukprot:10640156-Karenia_brevis.AAC.1